MTLRDRIKDAIGGSDTVEQHFRYYCHDCDSDFTSTEVSTSIVECPDCGATGTPTISSV